MITLTVNGERRTLREGTAVAHLVDELACGRRGVAIAVNEVVVPRSRWIDHELSTGDRIEVLRAAQGG